MILDKAIILKGLAGVTAVGGLAATGGFVFKKQLGLEDLFSSSPEGDGATNNQGNNGASGPNDQVANERPGAGEVPGGTDPQASVRSGGQEGGGSGRVEPIIQPGTDAPNGQISKGPQGADRADTDHTNDDHSDLQQVQQLPSDDQREELGLPKGCKLGGSESSKSCSITKDDLAKIEFSNRGNEDLTVEGAEGQTITLEITKVDNDATYTNNRKYTFKGLTKDITLKVGQSPDNVITLKGNEENDFKENTSGKLENVPKKVLDDTTIKKLNEKIQNLGLPNNCNFDKEKEPDDQAAISCDIENLESMNKIVFSDKTDNKKLKTDNGEDDEEGLDNLKIKIKKLTETEKNSYVSDLEEDLLFTFRDLDETLKWEGEPKVIFLPEGSNTEFKLADQKLSKLWSPKSLAQKVGLVCQDDGEECTIPSTNLNFYKDSKHHNNISISSGKFKFSKDEEGYNQGIKYTYEGNEVTSGAFSLKNSDKFEIKYNGEHGWYLSHKA